MEKERVHTLSEVSQHILKTDCWFIINGGVYDVTKFLNEHPGGEEVLMEYAGKDATEGFEAIGHSKEAHRLLSKFQVGLLQGYSVKKIEGNSDERLPEGKKEMEAYVIKDGDSKLMHKILVQFLPLVVVGVYLYYRWMA